jgi:hypothetical protein
MFLYTYIETLYDTIRNIITVSQLPNMINTYIIILHFMLLSFRFNVCNHIPIYFTYLLI